MALEVINAKLHRSERSYWHYCPGCEALHPLPDSWQFDGDLDFPTFSPSFKHTLNREGKTCHYFITKGNILYLQDCHHDLRGKTIAMPDIPEGMKLVA